MESSGAEEAILKSSEHAWSILTAKDVQSRLGSTVVDDGRDLDVELSIDEELARSGPYARQFRKLLRQQYEGSAKTSPPTTREDSAESAAAQASNQKVDRRQTNHESSRKPSTPLHQEALHHDVVGYACGPVRPQQREENATIIAEHNEAQVAWSSQQATKEVFSSDYISESSEGMWVGEISGGSAAAELATSALNQHRTTPASSPPLGVILLRPGSESHDRQASKGMNPSAPSTRAATRPTLPSPCQPHDPPSRREWQPDSSTWLPNTPRRSNSLQRASPAISPNSGVSRSPAARPAAEVFYGIAEEIRWLFSSPSATWSSRRLLECAEAGDKAGVERQLRKAAFINQRGPRGWTPLGVAILKCHRAITKGLLDAGAEPSIACYHKPMLLRHRPNSTLPEVCPPMHAAAFTGCSEMVRLLANHGLGVDDPAASFRGSYVTPLCVARGGSTVELIQRGANVHFVSDTGLSPLMYAIEREAVSSVKKLCLAGSNVNLKSGRIYNDFLCGAVEETPLLLAALRKGGAAVRMVESLIAAGANANCCIGASPNAVGVIDFLLEAKARGRHELNSDDVDLIRVLLQAGAEHSSKAPIELWNSIETLHPIDLKYRKILSTILAMDGTGVSFAAYFSRRTDLSRRSRLSLWETFILSGYYPLTGLGGPLGLNRAWMLVVEVSVLLLKATTRSEADSLRDAVRGWKPQQQPKGWFRTLDPRREASFVRWRMVMDFLDWALVPGEGTIWAEHLDRYRDHAQSLPQAARLGRLEELWP